MSRRTSGFTLIELLVALVVISIALTIVTGVFSVTTQTAGQAAAVSEIQNQLRDFALKLEADLDGVDPSRSVLTLVGRTRPAALTQDGLDAGQTYQVLIGNPDAVAPGFDPALDDADPQYSHPRADILAFFTTNPATSLAPPQNFSAVEGNPGILANKPQEALLTGATFNLSQVVYGHAAIAQAVRDGSNWEFSAPNTWKHIDETVNRGGRDLSVLPANQWVLARRQAIIEPPGFAPRSNIPANAAGFSTAQFDRISRCYSDDNRLGGDVVTGYQASPYTADGFHYDFFLSLFHPFSPVTPNSLGPAFARPYDFGAGTRGWNDFPVARGALFSTIYGQGTEPPDHHIATVIKAPPEQLRSNLGLQALPGCVWFEVEFLMPEDPRNGPDHPSGAQRGHPARWVGVEPGETYVFVPDSSGRVTSFQAVSSANQSYINLGNREVLARAADLPNTLDKPNSRSTGRRGGGGAVVSRRVKDEFRLLDTNIAENGGDAPVVSNRRIRLWPYAMRITVRVADGEGRLESPISRTIVHRFD